MRDRNEYEGCVCDRIAVQHARRNGSTTASSFESIASRQNTPPSIIRPFITASVDASAAHDRSSAVRPLTHSTAMLIPWKLNAHSAEASALGAAGRLRRRATMKSSAAPAREQSEIGHAVGKGRHARHRVVQRERGGHQRPVEAVVACQQRGRVIGRLDTRAADPPEVVFDESMTEIWDVGKQQGGRQQNAGNQRFVIGDWRFVIAYLWSAIDGRHRQP